MNHLQEMFRILSWPQCQFNAVIILCIFPIEVGYGVFDGLIEIVLCFYFSLCFNYVILILFFDVFNVGFEYFGYIVTGVFEVVEQPYSVCEVFFLFESGVIFPLFGIGLAFRTKAVGADGPIEDIVYK